MTQESAVAWCNEGPYTRAGRYAEPGCGSGLSDGLAQCGRPGRPLSGDRVAGFAPPPFRARDGRGPVRRCRRGWYRGTIASASLRTAAFEIALACDILLAAESASFGLVETVVGLHLRWEGPSAWPSAPGRPEPVK